MTRTITCICCPVGCRLQVTVKNDGMVFAKGNQCKRGLDYARQECVSPKRMITAVIKLQNHATPLSVKTEFPIPKDQIFACMDALSTLRLCAPIAAGQTVYENICGTGVNVLATKGLA